MGKFVMERIVVVLLESILCLLLLLFLFWTFSCNLISYARQKGFQHLYTLKQGVYHYLENKGPVQWIGNLFVFDSGLSLPPPAYKHEATTKASMHEDPENNTFARCYTCGSQVSELRHRNCANLECNDRTAICCICKFLLLAILSPSTPPSYKLKRHCLNAILPSALRKDFYFRCCLNREKDLRGPCCSNCTTAPRLRAVLPRFQRYKKWHTYQDSIPQSQLTA